MLSKELLLQEFKEFKPWSGLHLVGIRDSKLTALGSGGLLKYKNRYFVLTNYHVVKGIQDLKKEILIPYTIDDEESFSFTIIDVKLSPSSDIAVLEIRFNESINRSNHRFLDEKYLDLDIETYTAKTNVLYLHGYPTGSTTIDDDRNEMESVTFPYCTYVDKYDTYIESIFAYINDEGTSEFNETVRIPVVAGMSGSFVYGYYYSESPKFKLLGILTNWHIVDERLEIYPIREFIDFLNDNFFQEI